MTSIYKTNMSAPIADAESGLTADVIEVGGIKRLATTTDGTFSGTVTVSPPSDFRVATIQVTGVATPIVFADFTIYSISIRALDTNDGDILVGKAADIDTNNYRLDPQGTFAQNVLASTSPVAVKLAPGTTSASVTVVVSGNPV